MIKVEIIKSGFARNYEDLWSFLEENLEDEDVIVFLNENYDEIVIPFLGRISAGDAIFQITGAENLNNRPEWEGICCEVFEKLANKLANEIIRKSNNLTTTYKGFKLTYID